MHLPSLRRPLRASRIGDPARRPVALIGEGGEARIHSVFRSAINIQTGASLLALVPDTVGGLPNGILLDEATPLPDLRRVGVRPGALVTVLRDVLAVPSARFSVDLGTARTWSPRLPARDGSGWPRRSTLAWCLARKRSAAGGIESLSIARARAAALSAAIGAGDHPGASAAARTLIGLGPGLTPSGDDVLAGVEAALRALRHPVAGFLAGALDDIGDRTTSVSAALLRHAADGEFAERIATVVAALLSGSERDLPDALDRSVAWGATSGSDTLFGILVGLDAATVAQRVAA